MSQSNQKANQKVALWGQIDPHTLNKLKEVALYFQGFGAFLIHRLLAGSIHGCKHWEKSQDAAKRGKIVFHTVLSNKHHVILQLKLTILPCQISKCNGRRTWIFPATSQRLLAKKLQVSRGSTWIFSCMLTVLQSQAAAGVQNPPKHWMHLQVMSRDEMLAKLTDQYPNVPGEDTARLLEDANGNYSKAQELLASFDSNVLQVSNIIKAKYHDDLQASTCLLLPTESDGENSIMTPDPKENVLHKSHLTSASNSSLQLPSSKYLQTHATFTKDSLSLFQSHPHERPDFILPLCSGPSSPATTSKGYELQEKQITYETPSPKDVPKKQAIHDTPPSPDQFTEPEKSHLELPYTYMNTSSSTVKHHCEELKTLQSTAQKDSQRPSSSYVHHEASSEFESSVWQAAFKLLEHDKQWKVIVLPDPLAYMQHIGTAAQMQNVNIWLTIEDLSWQYCL